MSIVAKLYCNSVKLSRWSHNPGQAAEEVVLTAAVGPENAEWAAATPSAKFELTIGNPGAQGIIEPGKAYLVTITEAPE